MEQLEQNEIIISKSQLKTMTDSFYQHIYVLFDMTLTYSKLKWDGYNIHYSYELCNGTFSIDLEQILDKEYIINIVNDYIKEMGREAYDCSIIDNMDGTISLKVNTNIIKQKQKSKGGLL